MAISVMITTRNRCDCLRSTLQQLLQQKPQPDEILITADGCTDQTLAMIRTEFPECRLFINVTGLGSVISRDNMIRHASHEIIVSIDDDSYPLADNFSDKLQSIFDAHPEAAVITFPELRDGEVYAVSNRTPESPGHYVSFYANAVAAMRKSFYLRSRGFMSRFYHAYEELDYSLQSYAAGTAVWFEPSITFRHHYTPVNRNESRTHFYHARNELWSVWLRCPWPWLIPVAIYRILRQMSFAASNGISWLFKEPLWWWSAILGFGYCIKNRNPVPWATYSRWMKLTSSPIYSRLDLQREFMSRSYSVSMN